MAADAVPAGTFPSFVAEGTRLGRRGEHGKALACFNNALKLRGDKHCLVARSECHLKLGDTENALKDAEASLQSDKTFSKGLYQKAETLYTMGDFEFALVFYHRGHRLHPELEKFRLGIQKCEEAIVNCVGSPSSVKLELKEDLCFVSRQAESRKANEKLQIRLTKDQKWTKKQKPVRNPRTERQLLGEFYADKVYLEKLLKDKELMESTMKEGIKVRDLVLSGISYLESRSRFWQQLQPLYARRREHKLRQQRWARDKEQQRAELGRYIVRTMEDIDTLLAEGCLEESCKKAEHLLTKIQGWPDEKVPNKMELIGNLHSRMGNARLEMGQMEAALQSHRAHLELARHHNLPDAVSRALGDMGRVYARTGKFQKAIDTWEEKVPMAKCSSEKAWLFHEIGQCYLLLNEAETAQSYGEESLQAAGEAGDDEWQLHATVLMARAQAKRKDFWAAITSLEKELAKAQHLQKGAAQEVIVAALDEVGKSYIKEVSKSYVKEPSKRREETTVDSLKGDGLSSTNTKGDSKQLGGRRESDQSPAKGEQREPSDEEQRAPVCCGIRGWPRI